MRTLAVIGSSGSVDWLCWPRFDSPSIFGALLDDDGGSWTIESAAPTSGSRQVYLSGTNLLLTRFHGDDGLFEVEDFMVVAPGTASDTVSDTGASIDDAGIDANSQLLIRAITCGRGKVEVTSRMRLRPDYGRRNAAAAVTGSTVEIDAGDVQLIASGSVTWQESDGDIICSISLAEGETAYLALGNTAVDAEQCARLAASTLDHWRRWSDRSSYTGRWGEQVERSALVLKLLTHRETGGIIAAGTTSLPEIKGGERNWD